MIGQAARKPSRLAAFIKVMIGKLQQMQEIKTTHIYKKIKEIKIKTKMKNTANTQHRKDKPFQLEAGNM